MKNTLEFLKEKKLLDENSTDFKIIHDVAGEVSLNDILSSLPSIYLVDHSDCIMTNWNLKRVIKLWIMSSDHKSIASRYKYGLVFKLYICQYVSTTN